ncbi:MAG TPA: LytTR family DNA-binding domain-containing protein [Bacteroidales bacterium]|nr:LytTR family DNA-binding domain-containing protein [Bacteroidales bacterium]
MTCLIIEDEKVAAERLKDLILKYDNRIEILGIIQSVKNAVVWFNNHSSPDLVFMDIQLADGLSFEIFEKTIITAPVIFTTAYEEYSLRAFKVNSIDYLLKPIDSDDLKNAIDKFKNSPFNQSVYRYPQQVFDRVLKSITKEYKSKFVIKVGEHIRIIPVEEVCCFYSVEKATFMQTTGNRNYDISHSLDQLTDLLDPATFFRVNRQYMIAISSIKDIVQYSGSRLRLKILNNEDEEIIVSREKVQDFRKWLEH